MSRLDKNVLIRSHQPDALSTMYGRRCLTIFTSSAYRHYVSERTIALVDLDRAVKSVDDITIAIVGSTIFNAKNLERMPEGE